MNFNHAIFYMCGPPAMLNAMKSILDDKLKITKERIKVEVYWLLVSCITLIYTAVVSM